jgi:hypothetical protein
MAIRIPSSPVLAFTSSIASAVTDAATVLLPQDTDAVTVMVTSSVFGISTLKTFVQTTPDGGTTWLDMGCIGVIAATTGPTPATALAAPWVAHFDTIGAQINGGTTSVVATDSVRTRFINQVQSSAIGAGQYTGVPILGRNLRIFHVATGTGASDILTRVIAHQQGTGSN